MSFDLYVFDGDVPDDEAIIGEWMEDESRWGATLTPRLAAFVAELERRYPGLDDDPDNSPWASWPLTQAMVDGRCCGFDIAWSQSERMSAEMRALCGEHRLTLYDPQESLVLRPSGSPAFRRNAGGGNAASGCRRARSAATRSSFCVAAPACARSDDRALCAIAESLTFLTNRGLDDSRQVVETITKVDLAPHDSLYRGGDYFLGRSDSDGEVIVQRNDDLDERAIEVDALTVIYVGPTTRADELIEAFAHEGLQLFTREA